MEDYAVRKAELEAQAAAIHAELDGLAKETVALQRFLPPAQVLQVTLAAPPLDADGVKALPDLRSLIQTLGLLLGQSVQRGGVQGRRLPHLRPGPSQGQAGGRCGGF